ncbi:hypothetical protein DIPPA_25767 [Diplonema papillatum]|nr:hypothetical protein DIPPA_25767 [Diplonema papillatum]
MTAPARALPNMSRCQGVVKAVVMRDDRNVAAVTEGGRRLDPIRNPPRVQSALEIDCETTGIPWLDDMHREMRNEMREAALAGQQVGAYAAYATRFDPKIEADHDRVPSLRRKPRKPCTVSGSPGPAVQPIVQASLKVPSGRHALAPIQMLAKHGDNTQLVPADSHKLRTGAESRASPGMARPKRSEVNPAALGTSGQFGAAVVVPYAPTVPLTSKGVPVASKMNIKDYSLLALASQRGGCGRTEANAYYKIGELCNQAPELRGKAIKCFERYRVLSQRLGDQAGEAKALNSLGIVYQNMGGLEDALRCHKEHLELGDPGTLFIAHTNVGLVMSLLGDQQSAMGSLKNSMQYAIRSGDKQAELLALANLGIVGRKLEDYDMAQVRF